MLENGSDLHVNGRQKIRRYRARSTGEEEEERQMAIFYFEVARGPVPVAKLESLESRLDHV